MTLKEIRTTQLDELKQGIAPGKYIVSRLSRTGSFLPVETFSYETLDAALDKYDELLHWTPSGFLRLHAEFDISRFDHRRY